MALLIPLLLGGMLFVGPPAHAQPLAAAVVANILPGGATNVHTGNGPFTAYPFSTNENVSYPTYGPGSHIWVYVDVINVTGLFSYQVGFTFNNTVLQINNATGPGQYVGTGSPPPISEYFLPHASDVDGNASDATVTSNATGVVPAQGFYLTSPSNVENGSGVLLKACFCINPTLTHTVANAWLMNFSLTETETQLILVYQDGSTIISPPESGVYNGYFTLYGPIPEFPSMVSSIVLSTVLILATFAAAVFVVTESRRRKERNDNRQT